MKLSLFVAIVFSVLSPLAWAETAKVSVNGMVCSFCAQGIKKKFSEAKAVEKCDVDLDKKLVQLTFKKDQKMTDEEIKKSIREAGYEVRGIERISP
jgi:periplasmic mercuric ion binding protein